MKMRTTRTSSPRWNRQSGYHWRWNSGPKIAAATGFANTGWFKYSFEISDLFCAARIEPTLPMDFIVFQMADDMYQKSRTEGIAKVCEDRLKREYAGHIGKELKTYFDQGEAAFRAYRNEHGAKVFFLHQLEEVTIKTLEWSLGHGDGVKCNYCKGFAHDYEDMYDDEEEKEDMDVDY